MRTTLILTDSLRSELVSACAKPLETAGVLFARCSEVGGARRLLGIAIEWVDDASYLVRHEDRLSISSSGYVAALSRAEKLGAIPVWIHTHPGDDGVPLPSRADDEVDRQIADVFRIRSGSPYYGAAIISPRTAGFAFCGHLENENGDVSSMEAVWLVGDRLAWTPAYDAGHYTPTQLFDRNIRAFGLAIQQTLGSIHVGIVGCGGTGSAVAEQLARLGVKRFTLADPDTLSKSNVTRVYGSSLTDVGRPKVDVTADHLRRISPDVTIETIQMPVTIETVARKFACCDAIFGCTDDNAGRLVLSRLSTYYLIPVFDCGVLLSSDSQDLLTGIYGRVTTLVPGQACLVCRGRIDLQRAASELLTPDERVRRIDEGYAPALGRVEPAVVAYTTMVASIAVGELMERLVGYGPEPRPSEVLVRAHEREMSTNVTSPREGHYCSASSNKIGAGDRTPFLDQTWPS